MPFSMSFDPQSLAEIAQMAGFGVYLSAEVQHALAQSAQLIADRARQNTWQVFENPTGALAESIAADVSSPYEAQVTVGVPYGARREYGFSGKTDALGRFYAYDPAKPYLEPAMQESEPDVLALMTQAVDAALGRIAV